MGDLNVGDIAPDFTLEGTAGPFTLSDHRGERVVLLFYPGDDTTVCTKQFCSYRDASEDMGKLDAVFVGISTQDMGSHERFKAKYGLTTPLLADSEGEVSKAYDVFTKRFGGIAKRTVFVIDAEGRIAHKHSNPMSLTYDGVDELREALEQVPAKASS
jgi:thioredoxin-dependent peroxiredoxin